MYILYTRMGKTTLVISCFYDVLIPSQQLPVGFNWAQILATKYKEKYNVTILLHGECLKYGLKSSIYEQVYGTPNPYAEFLRNLHDKHCVKIVICHLCLKQKDYLDSEVLRFIKPISFSIDYIAQAQLRGQLVIYDAQELRFGADVQLQLPTA